MLRVWCNWVGLALLAVSAVLVGWVRWMVVAPHWLEVFR